MKELKCYNKKLLNEKESSKEEEKGYGTCGKQNIRHELNRINKSTVCEWIKQSNEKTGIDWVRNKISLYAD